MTTGDAFNIFAKKVIEVGGFSFEVASPNASLQNVNNSQDYNYFNSADEGLTYLNSRRPSGNSPYFGFSVSTEIKVLMGIPA